MDTQVRKRKLTSPEGERLPNIINSDTDCVNYAVKDNLNAHLNSRASSGKRRSSDAFNLDESQSSCGELVNGTEPALTPKSTNSFDFDKDEQCLQTLSVSAVMKPPYRDGNCETGTGNVVLRCDSAAGKSCEDNIDSGQAMPKHVEEIGLILGLDQNGSAPPELNFREVPETPASRRKVREIEDLLSQQPVNVKKLRKLAISDGGLVNDNIRKRAWSKLVGIDQIPPLKPLTDAELEANGEYSQVVLDVNRSLKRFPPGIPYDQRVVLQDQLTRLIMRVIIKHPHLRYYQGYHDVAVTVLLVVGEEAAFPIMEELSTGHLNECMAETMDKTSHLLNYIYPLLKRMHFKLYDFMERSGVGTLFCLPWYLTWFGHNLNHYTDVVRLYDYFMSSEKLLPLYLAAAIVVHRKDEIFNVECDMPYVHSLLSNIPDDLPFEKLLKEATQLYKKYPPSSIENEVNERTRLARMQMRGGEEKAVSQRPPLRNILQLMPRYSLFLATATLVVGLYAYIRTASALDPDALFPFS